MRRKFLYGGVAAALLLGHISFHRKAPLHASTLQDFVKVLAGELTITAKFPQGTVEITQFEDVKKAAAGKD